MNKKRLPRRHGAAPYRSRIGTSQPGSIYPGGRSLSIGSCPGTAGRRYPGT